MIYFIRSISGGPIKIGTTIRLSQRLKQLCRETGDNSLQVLAVVQGSRDEEQSLHGRFAHLQKCGEWFEAGADLLGFIVSTGQPWDGNDEVPAKQDERVLILHRQGSRAYRDWLALASKSKRMPVTVIADVAIAEWAERNGLEPPPER